MTEIKIQIDTKTDDNDVTLYRATLTPTDGGYESNWTEYYGDTIRNGQDLLVAYLTFDNGDTAPMMTREEAVKIAYAQTIEIERANEPEDNLISLDDLMAKVVDRVVISYNPNGWVTLADGAWLTREGWLKRKSGKYDSVTIWVTNCYPTEEWWASIVAMAN